MACLGLGHQNEISCFISNAPNNFANINYRQRAVERRSHLFNGEFSTYDTSVPSVLGDKLTNLLAVDVGVQESFEPIMPDPSVLIGMATIVALSAIAGSVWANQVVPVSRAKLAISKSRGEVKEYLDELREDDIGQNGMESSEALGMSASSGTDASSSTNTQNRGFEQWLFSDWLNSKKGEKKDSAVPFLKDAKWNSGDNPVLVASALIMACVLFASISERVF
mmetsp:Transcript_32390/g.39421  ORF Transcript_32390/g.39421 Transcript_32390/m.39421 type:complete len:223 (+) Transcript_32390:3-671(+)